MILRSGRFALFTALAIALACGGNAPEGPSTVTVKLLPALGYAPYSGIVAYQDGSGPWTALSGKGGSYQFPVSDPAGRYGIALSYEQPSANSAGVSILHATVAELSTLTLIPPPSGNQTDTVRVTITLAGESGQMSCAGLNGVCATDNSLGTQPLNIGSPTGTFDLTASRQPNGDWADRVVLRRGVVIPGDTDLGTVDFEQDGTPTQAQTLTVSGTVQGDQLYYGATFSTAAELALRGGFFPSGGIDPIAQGSSETRPFTAFPAALLKSGDVQEVFVEDDSASIGEWTEAHAFFSTPADVSLALPAQMDKPVLAGAGVKWTPLADATAHAVIAQVTDDAQSFRVNWDVLLTRGWTGTGTALEYHFPDLSKLPGADPNFVVRPGESLEPIVHDIVYSGKGFGISTERGPKYGVPQPGDRYQVSVVYGDKATVP